MENVFHNRDDVALVGPEWIDKLKSIALQSPLRRSRLCLHRSDDDTLHEMIIAIERSCLFQPHRHPFKTESFHMIEGRLVITIFDADGHVIRSLLMTPPGQGGMICYRMCKPDYHAILPLDPVVVFQETTNGPFVRGEAILADWAPSEAGALRAFLRRSAIAGGIPRALLDE